MATEDKTALRSVFQKVVDEGRGRYLTALRELCVVECGSEMVEGVNEVVSLVQVRR